MIAAPIVVIFLGYTAASYGYVLMRSWDITLRAWVSPLNPYQWPKTGPPPQVQPGQLFPGGAVAASAGGTQPAAAPAPQLPAGVTCLECLSRGGLCSPSQYRQCVGGIIKKLFG